MESIRINYAAPIDIPANYQCRVQSIGEKTCLCNAVQRQKVFVEKPIPSYLHYSVSSIYLCVCLCILLSAVEDDQYFSEVSFQFQACLFPLSTSRIWAELPPRCFRSCRRFCIHAQQWTYMCEHTHTHTHRHRHAHTHTHTHTPSCDPNSFYHVSKHSCASKPLFATLQITQLPRAWSSCPREPCSFIMWQAPALAHSTVHTRTNLTPREGTHSSICVCLSCWWLPSSEAVSQLGWFSPSSLPPAATYTSWAVSVNKKIQSTASSHIASPPLHFPPGCCKGKRSHITFTWQYVYMSWLSGGLVDQMMVAFGEKGS